MKVIIHAVHFEPDFRLEEHVSQKIQKLAVFSDKIIAVDVFLKLDNVVHRHKDKVAEIRVRLPKYEFFVKQTSKSFEWSFNHAFDSVVSQIKKTKERLVA
jgi:putative sigma-54 modulation protein